MTKKKEVNKIVVMQSRKLSTVFIEDSKGEVVQKLGTTKREAYQALVDEEQAKHKKHLDVDIRPYPYADHRRTIAEVAKNLVAGEECKIRKDLVERVVKESGLDPNSLINIPHGPFLYVKRNLQAEEIAVAQ